MKTVKHLVASLSMIGLVAALPASSAMAAKHEFNPQQTQAIEKIIHDYLITNPEVMYEVSQALEKQQQQELQTTAQTAIKENSKQLFSSNSPSAGNDKGDVVLVKFFDYQCGHCKNMKEIIDALIQEDNKLKVVFKELPIFGAESEFASKAALAAQKQGKYLELHAALLAEKNRFDDDLVLSIAKKVGLDMAKLKKDMASSDVEKELDENMHLAKELRLMGTPAFVVGGQLNQAEQKTSFIAGFVPQETLVEAISQARNR